MDPDILGPGNNRDAMHPIYQPHFESVESADSWLENDDLVGVLALDDEVHVDPCGCWCTTKWPTTKSPVSLSW